MGNSRKLNFISLSFMDLSLSFSDYRTGLLFVLGSETSDGPCQGSGWGEILSALSLLLIHLISLCKRSLGESQGITREGRLRRGRTKIVKFSRRQLQLVLED